MFSRVWKPDETLALVFEIVLLTVYLLCATLLKPPEQVKLIIAFQNLDE